MTSKIQGKKLLGIAITALLITSSFAFGLPIAYAAPPPANVADLSITKTASPSTVTAGSTLTYTLTVTNNGPNGAEKVVVTDALPPSVTFLSVTSTSTHFSCSQSSGVVTCRLGTIGFGSGQNIVTITLQVTVTSITAGSITNHACVSTTTIDPNTSNNCFDAITTIPPAPDFSLSASPNSPTIQQAASGSSTITVTSLNGFNSAVGLSLLGDLSGLTPSFSANSVTPSSGSPATSTLTIVVDGSTPKGTRTLTISGVSGSLLTHTATLILTVAQGVGTMTVVNKDSLGNLVTSLGTTILITPNPLTGSGSLTLTDNDASANDLDSTIGKIKVNAPFNTYTVTATQAPAGYILPSNPTLTNLVVDGNTPNIVVNFIDGVSASATISTTVQNGVVTTIATTPVIPTITSGQTATVAVPTTSTTASVNQLTIPSNSDCNNVSLTFKLSQAVPSDVQFPPLTTVALFMEVVVNNCQGFTTTSGLTGLVTISILVDKDIDAPKFPDGCPVAEFFLFDTNTNTWVALTLTRNPQADSGNNCGYTGQTPHLSKFSVGGIKPTSRSATGSGGYDANAIVDTTPPSILNDNWKPEVPSAGKNLTIYANIVDDVGVKTAAVLYYGPDENYKQAHLISMKNFNPEWFTADIPGSDVNTPDINFWIVAVDDAGNSAKTNTTVINVQKGAPPPQIGPSTTNLPATVLQQIKPKHETPTQQIEVVAMMSSNAITSFPDRIVIRNTGNITADNIRIMLSPEIAHSFRLGTYTVGSIAPHSNVTISLQHIGNPNKDVFGGLTGYNGNVLVMGEHLTPILLPVIIEPDGSYLQGHRFIMPKLSGMEQQHNREISMLSNGKVFSSGISLLNSILKHPSKNSNYEVTTSSKDDVITKPSGEIVIKNLSDKELQNIRIVISGAGNVFLLDNKVIHHLAPHAQISIRMIPTIDTRVYSPKDFKGELLIVPSNDNPVHIPINITAAGREDSANEFEVSTQGKDGIFTATEKVVIKNNGNRTMDSVRLVLSNNLARVVTLSNDSFKHIDPDGKVIVEFKFNAGLRTFMENYKGELIIASEHHNIRSIPISIEWKKVESNHFVIYARSGDEQTANQLINFLESNYQKITSIGKMDTKAVIYITNNMDEMKLVNPSAHAYYSYADDKIFVCKCDDPKFNALKEFVYRLIINNYPSYHNTKKILLDKENWLLDGISNYIASKIYDHGIEKKQIDAFATDPTGFEWYGYGSDAKYGAVYTFIDYLTGKYGDNVIDRTLYYLGSGMVSNHRCDALEDCAVLRAVYDVNGLNMEKSYAHTIDVKTLIKEWEGYVIQHYGIDYIVHESPGYDLSKLNTFQKAEAMNALARQDAGMPLTPTEEAVLDLAKNN